MASIGFSGDTSGLISVTAPLVAGSSTLTLPLGTDTLAGIAATQTLTNKTLTSPTITGATITVAATAAPAFSAYGTAGQSIAHAVWTKIAYNTELFDTNSNYDNATNYRFTPTVSGYYQINATIFTSASAAGLAFFTIYKNGSLYLYGNTVPNTNGGYITVNGLVNCNGSTDYIETYALQNSGVSLSFGSSTSQFQFSGAMIRSA